MSQLLAGTVLHYFFIQGSLKEKTVENLEKYVVKDVSICACCIGIYCIVVGVVILLISLMFVFPLLQQAKASSPP